MNKIRLITVLALILSAGLWPMPVNAADLLSGAVGYAIGKSATPKEKKIVKSDPIIGMLPIKCVLDSAGGCIGASKWKRSLPVSEMCELIGKDYVTAGFLKVGNYAGEVLILCKRP